MNIWKLGLLGTITMHFGFTFRKSVNWVCYELLQSLITFFVLFSLIETGTHKIDPQDCVSFVTQEDVQFSIWVSFFEIYNELIYDLLETPASAPNRKRPPLRLCEDHTGNTYVKGTAQPSHPVYKLD